MKTHGDCRSTSAGIPLLQTRGKPRKTTQRKERLLSNSQLPVTTAPRVPITSSYGPLRTPVCLRCVGPHFPQGAQYRECWVMELGLCLDPSSAPSNQTSSGRSSHLSRLLVCHRMPWLLRRVAGKMQFAMSKQKGLCL